MSVDSELRARALAALAALDREQLGPKGPIPDSVYRELAVAMDALYGPLPEERTLAVLRVIDSEDS